MRDFLLYFFKIEFFIHSLFILYSLFIMVHSIDSLCARIIVLENIIQSLLSSKTHIQSSSCKRSSGFHAFARSFRPHIRSSLLYKHFLIYANYNFIPSTKDINREIALAWASLSSLEKSHWILLS